MILKPIRPKTGTIMDNDWERVKDGDPEQCESSHCKNKRLDGSKFCAAHGGNKGQEAAKRKSLRNYRLGKWYSKVAEKAHSPGIKDLTEEIAILREMLDTHMSRCEDEADLILKSGPISDLTVKINSLVTNCNAIDKTMGNLIDKERVVSFAQAIIEIITPHVPEEHLDEINSRIQDAISEL